MDKKIQFLQGIYIRSGGANVATTRAFLESLEHAGCSVEYVEMFPNFARQLIRKFCTLILALPFSVLKGRLCVFEYFYKISIFSLIKFMLSRRETCIFNHHSTFYLALISKIFGQRIIFIVHDSVYQKACRSNERIVFLKMTWNFERFIMRLADRVLFVSDSERQFCTREYNLQNSSLVSIMSHKEVSEFKIREQECFCIIGDWRRKENKEGLMRFLGSDYRTLTKGLEIKIFGIGLHEQAMDLPPDVTICGKYESLTTLPYRKFIVPIWKGAGVKRKVLELLFADRIVYGTDVAFDGIPDDLAIRNIVKISIVDHKWECQGNKVETNSSFPAAYFSRTKHLGDLAL